MRFRGRVLMFMLFVASFRATTVSGQGISSVNDAANIGLPENGVFTGSDFDMVQTNNGYIHVRIPLIDLNGLELSYPFEFVYASSSFYETVKTVSNGHGGYANYYTWQLATGVALNGNPPWKLVTPTNFAVTQHQSNTAVR